ncbi:MAG TPA: cation diffusion facilitator family transporter [Limnobacter sp.]|uniref:cation diffusion facilitator family transporter n=1 Tax=Limnobacter sp. TaxID=2003368 RepID=UPI002E3821B6|nr:cation diffusion facilitator family transporter [Limnobacter sp.]HEX5485537.1 cation diffusion facilitator family transporter [Limnobacter sp.]
MPHSHHHHNDHGHEHDHDKHHGHHHHHHELPKDFGLAFALAVGVNTLFVVIEFVYGFLANSTALMADAGHNLSDVLGLLLAWAAAELAKKEPNRRFTYGLRGSSILAATANAALLLVACGAIAWEAVQRFWAPSPVAGNTVMIVAGIGILVNSFSAWLFMRGSKHDLNIRGAYLHMAADAAVSLGVVIAGFVMTYTGWQWLDPAVSLVIVLVIVYGTWDLLRESLELSVHAVPQKVNLKNIESYLRNLPGVSSIHDLHVWGVSTTENALTVHLVTPDGYPGDEFMDAVTHSLAHDHGIHHSTLQIEQGTTHHICALVKA